MSSRLMLVTALLLALVPLAHAQDDVKPTHDFHMMDGSTFAGTMDIAKITVRTAYGDLVVPVSSVVGITPGLDSHPSFKAEVQAMIEALGSDDFEQREKAQRDLEQLGPKIRGMLEPHRNSPDAERSTRIGLILTAFDEILEDWDEFEQGKLIELREGDQVKTQLFTIVGRIEPAEFAIRSSYGALNISLDDVDHITLIQEDTGPVVKRVAVSGSDMASTRMKSSGIRVRRGDRVTITASGNITMTPWGNNAVTGPEGMANYGWYQPNEIPMGALVGRIGGSGEQFKVGQKHVFTAKRSGVLQLGFGMQPNYGNQQFPGEFDVKITVESP